MDSLDVGIVKGGKEYFAEGIVGGHDSWSMFAEDEGRGGATSHDFIKKFRLSFLYNRGAGGDVTFVSHSRLVRGLPVFIAGLITR